MRVDEGGSRGGRDGPRDELRHTSREALEAKTHPYSLGTEYLYPCHVMNGGKGEERGN